MVRANRNSGDFCSVLSGARSAPVARAKHDARSGRRNAGMVHEIDAARGRARLHVCLPAHSKKTLAATVRTNLERRNAELLSAASVQTQLCDATGRLVRSSASRRRFRRNLRDLADPGFRLAETLRRLESLA